MVEFTSGLRGQKIRDALGQARGAIAIIAIRASVSCSRTRPSTSSCQRKCVAMSRPAQRFGLFLSSQLTAELLLQIGPSREELPRAHPDRARHPIAATQFVQHRAADARHGVGAERQPTLGLEALERLHEPERSRSDQIVQFDVTRDPSQKLMSAVVDQPEIPVQELRPDLVVSPVAR